MSCVYFAAILTILPAAWARPGSFMLAPVGPGCKSAGPCHL